MEKEITVSLAHSSSFVKFEESGKRIFNRAIIDTVLSVTCVGCYRAERNSGCEVSSLKQPVDKDVSSGDPLLEVEIKIGR